MLTYDYLGDWVHIRNPNDPRKPIVAQIYRLWQDEAGKKWINACWYYRPEQTVHRASKRFYKNEVMKTGQYRDHQVDDIVDRCFVMFHTRYHKGRPRGFPPNKETYVCEARYNEEKYTFNRIKTWTSCLPDEVREKDYEMDLFDIPRKLRKEPTPIAHLLAPNARETDAMPKPNWGHKDAPPLIGAVHIRPRESNVSHVLLIVFHQFSASMSAPKFNFSGPPLFPARDLRVSRTRVSWDVLGTGNSLHKAVEIQPQSLIVSDSLNLPLCTRIFLIHPCPIKEQTAP